MPRLRTTAGLSLLALVVGVAGTAWLSDQTYRHVAWKAAPHRASVAHVMHRGATHTRHVTARNPYTSMQAHAATTAAANDALIPVSMPVTSVPVARMESHAVGELVLHLRVDGQGQVIDAFVAQSSGDAVLDANAIAMARRWRFAVSADRPQGMSGDLPMRFTGVSARLAQVR
ncbi:energy transducer TonB [Dyella monticola]|uniref:Energy transducer TonB n=1 Tax=Dyella monticola TaxID=1927958 RepID=A0A370X1F2_9GAMM|nr:energy transducer TonB [Dyella monticola]RDS82110.1 energy transducer TonB [Dyella monticola]